jgi:hypothetical protein
MLNMPFTLSSSMNPSSPDRGFAFGAVPPHQNASLTHRESEGWSLALQVFDPSLSTSEEYLPSLASPSVPACPGTPTPTGVTSG